MVADQGIADTEGLTAHDCRRYYGSLNIMSGVHYLRVSKLMGHANAQVTLKEYATEIANMDTATIEVGNITKGKAESWQIPDVVEAIA